MMLDRSGERFSRFSERPSDTHDEAWIALCYTLLGYFHHLPRDVAYSRAKTAASTSLALDDELGGTPLTIGFLKTAEGTG